MDKFEQLTAYFRVITDFNQSRHIPLANIVSLNSTLPDFAAGLTSPRLIARMATILAANPLQAHA